MALPSEVVESLRELTRGEVQRELPQPHVQMLIEQGYAHARDGKILITPLGRALLAMRSSSWNHPSSVSGGRGTAGSPLTKPSDAS